MPPFQPEIRLTMDSKDSKSCETAVRTIRSSSSLSRSMGMSAFVRSARKPAVEPGQKDASEVPRSAGFSWRSGPGSALPELELHPRHRRSKLRRTESRWPLIFRMSFASSLVKCEAKPGSVRRAFDGVDRTTRSCPAAVYTLNEVSRPIVLVREIDLCPRSRDLLA